MNGVQFKNELISFIGKELESISCAVHSISFSFGKNNYIIVESDFYVVDNEDRMWKVAVQEKNAKIFDLLDCKISDLEIYNQNRGMKITFANNYSMVFASSDVYEDIKIYINAKEYVV